MTNLGKRVIYHLNYNESEALAHLGNNRQNHLPGIIVADWGSGYFNIQVFVDGTTQSLWRTSCFEGPDPGQITFLDPKE